ncbi:glycosyltransferase [Candidatus Allofournierella excrementigallinarum]|uniref:glycosyltransferase n=1 Tax=Candidatus Allofournierella excrementigallinarum TaxID=2838592 RepID=UPI00374EC32E
MRIAHINGVYGVGSTGRLVKDLVECGRENGHESLVLYSEGSAEDNCAVRYISDSERNAHALLSRLSGLQGYWSKRPTMRLIERLEKFSPDVVHLHVVHGNCLHLPSLFRYLTVNNIPVVLTLHDCWWFTGRCAYPLHYLCDRYQARCADCPAKNDVCPSWLFDRANKMQRDKERWLCGLAHLKVAAVSKWGARVAAESFLRNKDILCAYNWVDTQAFRPEECEAQRSGLIPDGKKVILGVSSFWDERKGLDDLLWLAQQLPECAMVLVGTMKQRGELPANVISVPATDSKEELAGLYSQADVFLNPSRMETFGLTTVEAMACGTPVVVYDVTACPELIGPGTGLVVAVQDGRQGLLQATRTLLETPASGERCVSWARENFSINVGSARYYHIYREIVEEKNKPA